MKPVLFWYNPNIHPLDEYQKRKCALITYAEGFLPLELIDEYEENFFLSEIGSKKDAPERCEICYRMRLEKTTAYAVSNGYDTFSTSLLVSPYQQHDLICSIGEKLAVQYGINFLYRDFRPFFRQGQAIIRSRGFYMQKYCGCGLK